jgi:hypothetical protein
VRVVADSRHLEIEPGKNAAVVLEVVNTEGVIDGVSARVIGMPQECVSAKPELLPLFPDTVGTVTLDLAVPTTHPAGRHPVTVEVISHGTSRPPEYLDLDLDVAARPGIRIESKPKLIRSRRSARYVLELANYGNVPMDVALSASDPDRQVQATFNPKRRRVEPGTVAATMLVLRGPRMFTGAEVDRTVTVTAEAHPVGAPVPAPAPSPSDPASADLTAPLVVHPHDAKPDDEALDDAKPLVSEVPVQLRQHPLIGRGLLTALILLSIVGVWAAIFLIGLAKVFSNDPMTKQAPASFFASVPKSSASASSASASSASHPGLAAYPRDQAAPAGALPKSGQLPAGLGGTINGTVLAADDGQPVGRILVQAYRLGRRGLVAMSSAASQDDGTYTLAGLFPTSYYIEFSASGYQTQWYPNRPARSGAQLVTAVAAGATSGINATIIGNPATMTGKVDPGDALKRVITTVTARPLLGRHTGQAIATTTTRADGTYRVIRLPAPGSYELTFTTPGYQESTLVDEVVGGDNRLEPSVILGAGTGQITGLVTDGTTALGGASVRTTVGGSPLNVLTPTTGQVGAYQLSNLPTPATYVITFSSPAHGTSTQVVDLAAGQSRTDVNVNLASGTGSISGRVIGPNKRGLGGATVAIGGAVNDSGATPSATTLTTGSPGSFAINHLRVPGTYTVTVTMPGFSVATLPVTLTDKQAAPRVTVQLTARQGSISGVVRGPDGRSFAGATVTATNGHKSLTATSDSSDGSYLIANLDPGGYSVTVTAPDRGQQTALVTVSPGKTSPQDLRLAP